MLHGKMMGFEVRETKARLSAVPLACCVIKYSFNILGSQEVLLPQSFCEEYVSLW